MTDLRVHDIECPVCGNKQKAEICHSLNVTNDPWLKDKFFEGKINILECNSCRKEIFLDVPLLYHDMEKKFLVQYEPEAWIDEDKFYDQFTDEGFMYSFFNDEDSSVNNPFFDDLKYMSQSHLVFNLNEMVQYIIFRDRLYEIKFKEADYDENSIENYFDTHSDCDELADFLDEDLIPDQIDEMIFKEFDGGYDDIYDSEEESDEINVVIHDNSINFIKLIGKHLNDDQVVDILNDYNMNLTSELDDIHLDINDTMDEEIYWAKSKKNGFLFRFNEKRQLDSINLYIMSRHGYTPINKKYINVPIYNSFSEAKEAFGNKGLDYVNSPSEDPNDKWYQRWIKANHGSYSAHYSFKDKKLGMITISTAE